MQHPPRFYLEGKEAWDTMLAACASAQESIDLEQYIFSDDDIGRRFVEVLRERASAGVKVRVLCDTVGSWNLYTSRLPGLMRQDGVEIRFINVVSPWRIDNFFSWFFRDHRKILIVDKHVGFTGGIGLRDSMYDWRDTNVAVEGAVVGEMLFAFNEMWLRAFDRDWISRMQRSQRYTRGFQFLTNAPYLRKRFLYYSIIDALRNAKKYAYITTPYFIPDRRLARVLKLAVSRGVDVRLILPGLPEEKDDGLVPLPQPHKVVSVACRSHYELMLLSGVKIYEYHKSYLHSKTIVVDDEWATVGSFNLDSLSFLYNYEANIVSTDESFAKAIKSHFEHDLTYSKEITYPEWIKRPFLQKFREFLVVPIRRFL